MYRAEQNTDPGFESIKLLDLPVNVLDKVMSHLDHRHHQLWRDASEDMKQVHNDYIIHMHKCFEVAHRETPMESDRLRSVRTMLQIQRQSISYFMHQSSESDVANSLLLFHQEIRLGYDGEDNPEVMFLSKFLGRLLMDLDCCTSDKTQILERRLQYTIALFGLLRQLRTFKIYHCGMKLLHWHLEVELSNISIGVVEDNNDMSRLSEAMKRMTFFDIIAELLYYDKMGRVFSGQKNTGSHIFTYGIQALSSAKGKSGLQLKFVVQAPKSIVDLLEDVINGKDDPSKPVQLPPESVFSARIEANCVRGPKINYSGKLHLSILKMSELV
ncbi:uncharacterized protein LOC108047799 [Drosophila rhopaloa]|uniref:Uncharacterized protein LOC108047799 n=1 Tax=Drosophila rhopaloa TaxID=1041015 RepID=A0A6P4F3Q0_DRORH|nr:uncharacterized protein LOC108047799 [Drosophila rhopaloa]